MRPALIVSVVLLVLLVEAQGRRLEQGLISAGHQRIFQKLKQTRLIEVEASDIGGDVVLCRDGHCSGRNRKLMTRKPSTAATTTTWKTVKSGWPKADSFSEPRPSNQGLDPNEATLSTKSSPVSEHRETTPEHYQDTIDIAGMDYSPANKKPPIHN